MSSSVHIDHKKEDILILGKGLTQRLERKERKEEEEGRKENLFRSTLQ